MVLSTVVGGRREQLERLASVMPVRGEVPDMVVTVV